MSENICGVVLAGGQSKRFGSDKAQAHWQRKPLLCHVIETMKNVFPRVFVVTRNAKSRKIARESQAEVIPDLVPTFHPLAGIYSAMKKLSYEFYCVTTCDAPIVSAGLLKHLVNQTGQKDVIVCRWQGKIQPFPGIYRGSLKNSIESMLDERDLNKIGLTDLLKHSQVYVIAQDRVRLKDPLGFSFQDVDTLGDLRELESYPTH